MKREKLFRYFFAAVFILLIFQALRILSPFFTGLFGAIILSLIFWPLHRLSVHLIGRERPNAAAGVSTALLFLLIIIPISLVGWLVFKELKEIYPAIERLVSLLEKWRQGQSFSGPQWLKTVLIEVHSIIKLSGTSLEDLILAATSSITEGLVEAGQALPKNAVAVFANFVVMVTTLFFLFRDGPAVFKKIRDLTPMDEKHKDQIVHQLYGTVTAIVRGVIIVASVQGILAGVGFALARVPSPILFGFLTSVCALIPLLGAAVVWVSLFVYYLCMGVYVKAGFLFVWGFFVISLVDNFLRPILIGGETKLPFLWLFLGLVGGMKVYGIKGLFLGPLTVALILAFIKIYREEYASRVKQKDEEINP